jgi:hypothetical protein
MEHLHQMGDDCAGLRTVLEELRQTARELDRLFAVATERL